MTNESIEDHDNAFVIDDDDDEEEEEIRFSDEPPQDAWGEGNKSNESTGTRKHLSAEVELPVRLQSTRTRERNIRMLASIMIFASLMGVVLYGFYDRESVIPAFAHLFHQEAAQEQGDEMAMDADAPFTEHEINEMRKRLSPKQLLSVDDKQGKTLVPKQFLHLHHMKTGGTSMDMLIRCGTSRLHQMGYTVPYNNLHECNPTMYSRCVNGTDDSCRKRFASAAVVSLCGPLRDLPAFSWTPSLQEEEYAQPPAIVAPSEETEVDHPVHAITVLRHPVERVWSMYRFKTKFCYKCKSLTEVYEIIDNGGAETEFGPYPQVCAGQLENHMTRNLIQHSMNGLVDDVVQQAIDDIKSFFTIIGLTEDMNSTRIMAGEVFPWLAETYEGSSTTCALTHANKSPQNNRCGPGGTHMELPSHPSEEEAELIRIHNELDMKVYHAAERQHRLQKAALGLEDP